MILFCSTALAKVCVLYSISDSSVPFDFIFNNTKLHHCERTQYCVFTQSMGNESFSHA